MDLTPQDLDGELPLKSDIRYFYRRIRPKLSELEDFRGAEEFPNLELYPHLQGSAMSELLQWRDDGTVKVSKGFREFYDGLLFYSNIRTAKLRRPIQELVDIFFEIHGSDPRNFPEAMKIGLRLLNQALMKLAPDREENGLWAVLAEASSLGSHAAKMLRTSLEHHGRRFLADAPGDPYGKLIRGEKWAMLPFAIGFGWCAEEAQKATLLDILERLTPGENSQCQAEKETRYALDNTRGATQKTVDQITEELLPPDLEIDNCPQIFVGPSGCGKTTKIQSLLKRHWGLYLLSGNLPKESDKSDVENRLEYKSRRGDGSRDTQTWFEQLKSLQELGLLHEIYAIRQAVKVLTARLWILGQFRALDTRALDTGTLDTNRTASDWLELQINCREPRNDIFNHIYRVLRFTATTEISPEIGLDSRFIFCFDEAQCDLPEILPGEMKWPSYSEKVRPIACMYMAAFWTYGKHNDPKNLSFFLSGTALQLRHMQQVIQSYATIIPTMVEGRSNSSIEMLDLDLTPKVNRDFRLVNGKNFTKLMNAMGHHYDKELIEIVKKHSESLHGRVLWSVCYLDEVRKLVDSHGGDQKKVLDDQVKEISMRVGETAKKGLKDRLEDMRRTRVAMDGSALLELQLTDLEYTNLQLQNLDRKFAQLTILESLVESLDNQLPGPQTTELRNMEKVIRSAFEEVSQELSYETTHDPPDFPDIGSAAKFLKNRPNKTGSLKAANQRHQQEELIDELCSLAIRSDLLGEATIFKSRESEDLVASGFAFLDETQDSSGSRVKLKERLAVDAAIEYFQCQKLSNGQSEYDRALTSFLYSQQSNASALGKVAELFFAWHLKKVLGTCADMIIPTLGDDYRMKVLGLLVGDAQSIEDLETRSTGPDLRSQIAGRGGDLSAFRLVEGERTAYQEKVNEERTITMWDWLEGIRNGKQGDDLRSTFWFPSNNTGPDILFALKREIPETLRNARELDYSLVLCAVQIKRERKIGDVGRAIATTNPNYWFSNNRHTRDATGITQELRHWQKKRYPIVRILVSALTGPSQYNKAEEGPTTAEKYLRERDDIIPSHQQYFTSIGAEHDGLLFGDAFQRLRIAQGIQTTREKKEEKKRKKKEAKGQKSVEESGH